MSAEAGDRQRDALRRWLASHFQCAPTLTPDEGHDEDAEDHALNHFLTPLITLRHSLPSTATIMDLTLENVKLNVATVVNSSAIQHAWTAGKSVCVHGWLYDIGTGLLSDIGVSKCGPTAETA